MLLIINKLCDLNYFVRDTFISAIKIKYTNNQHLSLLSSRPNSVKYSAQNSKWRAFSAQGEMSVDGNIPS